MRNPRPRAIYKYPLEFRLEPQAIDMPEGARVLCVQNQRNEPVLWALVDTERHTVQRGFVILPTGVLLDTDDPGAYVGTVQIEWTVWHVFEVAL